MIARTKYKVQFFEHFLIHDTSTQRLRCLAEKFVSTIFKRRIKLNNVENYEDEIRSFCVRQEKEFPGRGCMYPGLAQLCVK